MKYSSKKVAMDLYSHSRLLRDLFTIIIDKKLYHNIVESESGNLRAVQQKKYEYLSSLLYSLKRNISKKYLSDNFIKNVNNFISSLEVSMIKDKDPARDNSSFVARHGIEPPMFIVLSPTQKCNLNCTGCYASSSAKTAPTLPFEIVDRIVAEVHDDFNGRFITISGGEPFMYKDKGKTLIDIFRKYNDMLFQVYTNGTLIDEPMARKLNELGNVIPAISVEGLEKHTDERRGKGVHQKILNAFENLRTAGVPFGVSLTATSKNMDDVLNEAFYDYYFEQQGATFMWEFQFMPIGRGNESFELMVSPAKRVKMFRMWERMVKEKKYCIADFWNSGLLTHGCIAYGANRGHIYIDWNGNIMPCVFVPYFADNVYELFDQGKTIGDSLHSDFMKRGNKWQHEYGLKDKKHPGNWLRPCSIRDHYQNFKENILGAEVKAENPEAQEILNDREYFNKMISYDMELQQLTDKIWKEEYLDKG